MKMKPYKVIIVDDHYLFGAALKDLVNTFDRFDVIGYFKNGRELQNRFHSLPQTPQLALMDVNMPLMDGKETTKWLMETHPTVKVLALSMNSDERDIIQMLKSGAKGYILKDISPTVLKEAMLSVLMTGFFNNEVSSTAMMNLMRDNSETSLVLKEKEIQFLKLVTTEMTYKQIADEMNLSPKTIDGYREELFQKLGARSRIGLVLYAIKNNFVNINE